MSGLNFSKSEIVMINGDADMEKQFFDLFNCQVGKFSIKYLGVPVSPTRLHIADWVPWLKRIIKNWTLGRGIPCPLRGEPPLSTLPYPALSFIICQCTYCQK